MVYLDFQHLPEEEIYGTSIGQKRNSSTSRLWTIGQIEQIVQSRFTCFLSGKGTLHKLSPTFLRKTRNNCLPLFRRTVALKIIEEFQKNTGGGVKIDVLLRVIFHSCQTNNYITSLVSIHLNTLRICEECYVHYCKDLFLVTYIIWRPTLEEPSRTFVMVHFCSTKVKYFYKNSPSYMFD